MNQSPLRVTPVLVDPDDAGRLYKLENLQRTGSFKLRGAWAAVTRLSAEHAARGVVSASAGNHGAGLALAGKMAGVAVTVVVPKGTPQVKLGRMVDAGAEIICEGENYDAANEFAVTLARESSRPFISPYDHEDVIAGNGDGLAHELVMQIPTLKRVVVSVGGGGLIAGLARTLRPRGIEVVGIQPERNCAMHDSLADGVARVHYDGESTLAEGLEGPVCERTFNVCLEHDVRIELVSEAAIADGIRYAYRRLGQVVEASAAVAIAGAKVLPAQSGTVVIISGGNIDAAVFDSLVAD